MQGPPPAPPVPMSDMRQCRLSSPKPVFLCNSVNPSVQDSENAQVLSLSGCLWSESGLPWIVPNPLS